jgi:hypothetical protein
MLKLDSVQLLKDLEAELSHTGKLREPAPLGPRNRGPVDFLMLHLSRMNWRTVVVAAAVLLFVALAVILVRNRMRQPANPTQNLGPALYQPKPSRSGDTLPVPQQPKR